MQLILDIFGRSETELAVQIEEIRSWIMERNIKIENLLEQNEKISQEIRETSRESEIMISQYYQMMLALKLNKYTLAAEQSTGVENGDNQNFNS